jgi:hypothetical protein
MPKVYDVTRDEFRDVTDADVTNWQSLTVRYVLITDLMQMLPLLSNEQLHGLRYDVKSKLKPQQMASFASLQHEAWKVRDENTEVKVDESGHNRTDPSAVS